MQARNYRHVKNRAYTRKKYVRGFPSPKIVKFTTGDTKGTFGLEAKLIALERAQVRHSALEAGRVATNRILMDKLINDCLIVVHPYSHNILRKNKIIFSAHSDRLQQGIRRSFGAQIGTVAKAENNQPIMTVRDKASQEAVAKESLKRGSANLPIPRKIAFCKIVSSPTMTEIANLEVG